MRECWLGSNRCNFKLIVVQVQKNILPLRYAEGEELDSCSQTLVMWNETKVTPVRSCALPVVNPKTNEKYKVRFLVVKEDLTPLLGLNATQKNEAVNCTQGKLH